VDDDTQRPVDRAETDEMAPLYAIGALDTVTARAFKRRIENADAQTRREIEAELEAWNETTAQLPLALDPVSPDPRVKEELLRQISLEAQQGADTRTAIAGSHAIVTRSAAWYLLPLAAALILAVTSLLLYRDKRKLEAEVGRLAGELRTREQEYLAKKAEIDQIVARAAQMVGLSGGEVSPQASAKLFWDKRRQQWVIFFYNLPEAPPDKQYQFWYITKDQRKVSAALLDSASLGKAPLTLDLPPDIAGNVAAAGLTLEPRGGSAQPTGQLYLVGAL
jgi:anti-sigma-K factor RskA